LPGGLQQGDSPFNRNLLPIDYQRDRIRHGYSGKSVWNQTDK
jgi:hypothetical protein